MNKEIKQEILENLPIVYMRRIGQYGEENQALMKKMKEWIELNAPNSEKKVIYAIAQDNPAIVPPEKCRYDVCFVTDQFTNDTNILHGKLPNGKYSIFEIEHTAEAVKKFWLEFMTIFETNQIQLDITRPILERYDFKLIEKGKCEFCIPTL